MVAGPMQEVAQVDFGAPLHCLVIAGMACFTSFVFFERAGAGGRMWARDPGGPSGWVDSELGEPLR